MNIHTFSLSVSCLATAILTTLCSSVEAAWRPIAGFNCQITAFVCSSWRNIILVVVGTGKFCFLIMGCGPSKKSKAESRPGLEDPTSLASETPFTVSEVESLYELFRKLSSSLVNDGLIHKEELQLAFFKNSSKKNLFLDRVFYLFDLNGNGHIEFSEFVRSMAIFHPKTPDAVKASYAFRLYDLRQTGYIEREELKEMVLALFNESELNLSDDVVEMIVNKTFAEADAKSDGRIDEEEWKDYVATNHSLLKNMTLPYLMDISIAFPSFILNNETKQSEL